MPKPETCGRCGEEIRHGVREGATGWWHRLSVDHMPILGEPLTPEYLTELDRQLDLPRERFVPTKDGYPLLFDIVPYTTREYDRAKMSKAARDRADDAEDREPLPVPEVPAYDFDPADFAPRSGIRQVINLIGKQGWELVSCRHARGPYVGADGSVLSISDVHVVKARGPAEVDGGIPVAVASWRDGKFDFAYIGIFKDHRLAPHKVDATTMKTWIKGNRDLPDALPQPGE